MAISPPSDIVLDVARAVGPEGMETAKAALAKRAEAGAPAVPFEPVGPVAATFTGKAEGTQPAASKAYQKFESVVLQTFLQSMMPKDSEAVYGSGLAGDMWKQEMAQQIAEVMTKRGGIGIANRLLKAHYEVDGKTVPLQGVSEGSAKDQPDAQRLLSHALISDMQRKLTMPLVGGAPQDSDDKTL